jgi:ankyrin repeat protein
LAAPLDPAGRLRDAAAAGRAAEVKTLLTQGVPVDAAAANGRTPLMESIEADRPAIAALLRRHGASLDQRDQAGKSARDMAAAKGDAALNQALGLAP